MRRELLVLLLSACIFGCAYPEHTFPTKTEESNKEKAFSSAEQMKYDELVSFLGMAGSGQWDRSYKTTFRDKCLMEYSIAEPAVSEQIISDLPAEENGIQKRKTYQVKLGALNPNDVRADPTYSLGLGGETKLGILEVDLRLPSRTPTIPRSVREWRLVSFGPFGRSAPPGTVSTRPEGFVLKDGTVVPYTARGYFVHDNSPIDGVDFQIKLEVRSKALRVKQAFEEIIRLCGGKDSPPAPSEMFRRDR